MAVTWALSARPEPVTAALTSLGVCRVTGMPRRVAQSIATALACAVPITVRTLCWAKTRSTATRSGRCSSSQLSTPCSTSSSRGPISASAGVRTTPTPTIFSGRPGAPSTTPIPHLVRPGSTPSTRTSCPASPDSPLASGRPDPMPTRLAPALLRHLSPVARGIGAPLGSRPAARSPSDLRRLPPGYDRPTDDTGPVVPGTTGPDSGNDHSASSCAPTSSLMSKLAKTFCTSSLSSRASISLRILRAPSTSSSTCMLGRKLASAES